MSLSRSEKIVACPALFNLDLVIVIQSRYLLSDPNLKFHSFPISNFIQSGSQKISFNSNLEFHSIQFKEHSKLFNSYGSINFFLKLSAKTVGLCDFILESS